jgi:hypothetical protein
MPANDRTSGTEQRPFNHTAVYQFTGATPASISEVYDAFRSLEGELDDWDIEFRQPSDNEPVGALLFDHPQYTEHVGVYISSTDIDSPTRTTEGIAYDIYNPMETDILTVEDDFDDPIDALDAAVERANRELDRTSNEQQESLISRACSRLASLAP